MWCFFLQGYGVVRLMLPDLSAVWQESIDKVKGNPYRLADDIWGIGFRQCRWHYGIRWLWGRTTFAVVVVDTFMRSTNLATRVMCTCRGRTIGQGCNYTLLEADEENIRQAMTDMIREEKLMMEQEAVISLLLSLWMWYSKTRLFGLMNASDNGKHPKFNLKTIEKETGIEYDEVQITLFVNSGILKLMVLTGGPIWKNNHYTRYHSSFENYPDYEFYWLLNRSCRQTHEWATGMKPRRFIVCLEFNPCRWLQTQWWESVGRWCVDNWMNVRW